MRYVHSLVFAAEGCGRSAAKTEKANRLLSLLYFGGKTFERLIIKFEVKKISVNRQRQQTKAKNISFLRFFVRVS